VKTLGIALISALALPFAAACQKDDLAVAKRLDKMDEKLTSIDNRLQELTKKGGLAAANRQRPPRRRGPDPKTTYSIPVDGLPLKGNKNAKVTIVKAFEFACPACERARPFVDHILKEWGDKVRVVDKTFIVHPGRAETPSYAACAAHKQGKYAEMETLIWDKGFKARKLDKETMEALAKELKLDMTRFKADMAGQCVKDVARDHQHLKAIGTSGTPTFFVNGRALTKRSPAGLKELIEEELKKAETRVAAGTKPADYYDEWIVKKGKKRL
jgi:protein-disulfide isomerase